MSSTAGLAAFPPLPRPGAREWSQPAKPHERPLVRLAAFAALGLYGIMRWGSLLSPVPTWRLGGLLALAVLLAAVGAAVGGRSRILPALSAAVALVAALVVAGVPVEWVLHLRIAVIVNGIGQGLSALPRVLVPYTGINEWTRTVIVLGAGTLLLDGAVVLAFAPRTVGDLRRSAAALPLIALAVVPAAIARPKLPYLHGLVLFGLLALFVWAERVRRRDLLAALLACALAAAGAMAAAPALDRHTPWINYQALAGSLSPSNLESFDFSQRYGPLNWPRTGREVLNVQASSADYWKAEDLDLFDGRSWVAWTVDTGPAAPGPDPSALSRWSQTLKITVRGMKTTYLIAAGFASQPTNVPGEVLRGLSPGTWTSDADLGPGDTYLVQAYTPHPTAAELNAAGESYPAAALQGYLSLTMPQPRELPAQQVAFAPFGSPSPPQNVSDIPVITGTSAIAASPYARGYALARRLAAGARTPYEYVTSVQRYLGRGFRYEESPAGGPYPLATFLFGSKAGYCQHFAGAMALLLRMGGIPARVTAGFTTGTYRKSTHSWVATDLDAHAWVEAWFPHYGWVKFDPTPAVAPARAGHARISPAPGLLKRAAAPQPAPRRDSKSAPTSTGRAPRHAGGSSVVVGALLLVLLAGALVLALVVSFRRALAKPRDEDLLAELERAFARSGRPIPGGVTLASLEHRFRGSPEAAAYIRAIRLQRFGGDDGAPTARQRRALRAQLGAGLGLAGALRAIWALPPWRVPRENPWRPWRWA